jgi:hypothetical protein
MTSGANPFSGAMGNAGPAAAEPPAQSPEVKREPKLKTKGDKA